MKKVMTIRKDISELSARLGEMEGKTIFLTRKNLVRTLHIPVAHSRKGRVHELKATIGSGTGYMEILCLADLVDDQAGGTTVRLRIHYSFIYRVLIAVIFIAAAYYTEGLVAKLIEGGAWRSLDFRTGLNLLAPGLLAGLSAAVYWPVLGRYGRMLVRHFLDCIGEAEAGAAENPSGQA